MARDTKTQVRGLGVREIPRQPFLGGTAATSANVDVSNFSGKHYRVSFEMRERRWLRWTPWKKVRWET